MGRKGGRGHLKREASPKFWSIHKKEFTWTVKPIPGPHPLQQSIPLQIILREMLGFAKTRNEVKKILSQGKIFVDGKARYDEHFSAGLMDVISIPEIKKYYRLQPSEKGLLLHSITEEESKFKLCRIENKSTLANGHIQLNLHDGRNIMLRLENSQGSTDDVYQTLDTLKISLPNQEILEHLKLESGMSALIIGGKNIGKHGTIISIDERPEQKRREHLVTIQDEREQTFQTTLDYIFVIGDKTPRISLLGMEE
ncbi:MAG: 30S ribosomal protein S4e [Candidatus Bathyarchaeia archaeon]